MARINLRGPLSPPFGGYRFPTSIVYLENRGRFTTSTKGLVENDPGESYWFSGLRVRRWIFAMIDTCFNFSWWVSTLRCNQGVLLGSRIPRMKNEFFQISSIFTLDAARGFKTAFFSLFRGISMRISEISVIFLWKIKLVKSDFEWKELIHSFSFILF